MPFVVVDSFVSAVAECSTGAFSADRETSGCVRVNRWLEVLERLGQAGVFVIPCF